MRGAIGSRSSLPASPAYSGSAPPTNHFSAQNGLRRSLDTKGPIGIGRVGAGKLGPMFLIRSRLTPDMRILRLAHLTMELAHESFRLTFWSIEHFFGAIAQKGRVILKCLEADILPCRSWGRRRKKAKWSIRRPTGTKRDSCTGLLNAADLGDRKRPIPFTITHSFPLHSR